MGIIMEYVNIFSGLGLALFLFGASLLAHRIATHNGCTAQTEGKISLINRKFMDQEGSYKGLAYTVNGVEYKKPFSGSDTIEADQTVTVCYNPSKPKTFYVLENEPGARNIAIALVIGGILLLGIGYLMGTGALQIM
ncbi:MAG: DUF3592 domain-containing protein [Clostridiales bacterium]|nr:DUF3592 domain-containing protein [Clostridiales bacterium]